ncbi:IPT/TIG domain-containing protein [Tenacibaculum sp. ZH5_bin.1]|uniref:IPT/TIG domain-containing protein n=1 Tax=Tenacibaculum TaxID=104267 RepID=UPI00142FF066|nr:IPT/TIG domain-containing protein [Tenacibaculum mesophilum]KAF9658568.1 IPT/TIG domain-containing protein [Tenacibaculum mesophilum]
MKKQIFLTLSLIVFIFSCSQNETEVPHPTVSSYTPKNGYIGDTINILGKNFPSNIKVTLLDIETKLIQKSTTEIKAIVHEKVTKGNNSIKLVYNNEAPVEIGSFNAIIDDYEYLIYDNWNAKLFKIGNNTGTINFINQLPIPTPTQNSMYGFLKRNDLIYLIDFSNNPEHSLLTYNLNTKTSSFTPLALPPSITGGITAINWNITNNTLIGLVSENIHNTNAAKHHLIEINPINGQIKDLNISFNHSFISSHIVKNNYLFLFSSTSPYDLSKIDLTNYSIEKLSTNNEGFSITKPSLNSSSEIICLKDYGNSLGQLVKFNEETVKITQLSESKLYYSNRLGYGFFDKKNDEYIGVYKDFSIENSSGNQPTYNSLYKFNTPSYQEEKILFRPLKTSFTSPTIIDIIEL